MDRALPLLLAFAFLSHAQTGSISGRVTDPAGAAVPDVKMQLQGAATREASTTAEGAYKFDGLGSGDYVIVVSHKGFLEMRRNVTVRNAPVTVDLQIAPEPLRQSLTIVEQGAEGPATAAASATRTLTPLKEIPMSIQVVDRQLMEAQAAQSMQDAMRNVPGVSLHLGEARRDQVYIRGYNALRDMYVDGVRDDATYYRDLSGIEQIEVIKGPVSALYGRGAAGGIVNRVTKKPNPERPIVEGFATFGSYGTKRVGADLGLPLFDGKLAGRLTGATEDSGSHRHYYALDRFNIAPSLAWRPDANTDLLYQFEYVSDDRTPDRGVPSLNGRPAPVGPGLFYGTPQDFIINRVRAQALTAERRINGRWTIRNTFRMTGHNATLSNSFPAGVTATAQGYRVSRSAYAHSTSQDNLFNQAETVGVVKWLGMTHTILGGYEFGHQEANTIRFNGSAGAVDLYFPVLTPAVLPVTPTTNNGFRGNLHGIYMQDQITISHRWKALVGARHDSFKQVLDDFSPANKDLRRTDKQWSPRAGLVFLPRHWLSVYGSYSRSFIPSGDGLALAVNTEQLKPEFATNYEGGVKADLLGDRLSSTLSIFRLDRDNIRTIDPVNPNVLVQVGRQRTDGAEISLNGRITRNWRLTGGYAWLNASILKSNDLAAGRPIQGNRPAFIPLNTLTLWSNYNFNNGFGFGLGYYYQSNRFAGSDNTVLLPSNGRLDAGISYRKRRYEISANIRNLTNSDFIETAHGNFQLYPVTPVSGLLTLRYRW